MVDILSFVFNVMATFVASPIFSSLLLLVFGLFKPKRKHILNGLPMNEKNPGNMPKSAYFRGFLHICSLGFTWSHVVSLGFSKWHVSGK